MAHRTDALNSTGSRSLAGRWAGAIGSWLHARRRKNERKQVALQLLSYDERCLEDMGLSRWELVEVLGYDPRELSVLSGAAVHRIPHL